MNNSFSVFLRSAIFSFVLAGRLSGIAAAGDLSLDEILQRIERADDNISSLRFNFTQKIIFKLTGEEQVRKGEIIIKRPGNIRFTLKSPAEQILVSDGKKIRIYTPAYRQLVVDGWKKWLKNDNLAYSFFGIHSSFREFRKNYRLKLLDEGAGYDLELASIGAGRPSMTLRVGESFIPDRAVVFIDNVVIETDMFDIEVNPEIKKNTFKLKVPQKVNVIELD